MYILISSLPQSREVSFQKETKYVGPVHIQSHPDMESKHPGIHIGRPEWPGTSWNASVCNVQQVIIKDINAKEKGIKVVDTAENSDNLN